MLIGGLRLSLVEDQTGCIFGGELVFIRHLFDILSGEPSKTKPTFQMGHAEHRNVFQVTDRTADLFDHSVAIEIRKVKKKKKNSTLISN